MASIREELVLSDRFSATFGQFLNLMGRAAGAGKTAAAAQKQLEDALKMASGAMEDMAGSTGDAASAQERLDDAVDRATSSTSDMGDAANRAAEDQERMNRSMQQGQTSASGLERKILGLAKAYISLRTAQSLVGMSDTMTQTTARLDRMNDGLQTTAQLQEKIYQAAQRSRGAYQETADMVAKLGTLAGDAFNSSGEIVAFAEQINKQFALAGTNTQGAQAAMLQLTQAMSSGTLRGEELNSILEQAPTIAQAIANYLNVSTGEMREMASEGAITAQVVKNAMFAAAEETNAKFNSIPKTWGNLWTSFQNQAFVALQPALDKLNQLANTQEIQNAMNAMAQAVGAAADAVVFLLEHMSILGPIIGGVAAMIVAYNAAAAITSAINTASAFSTSVKAAAEMMSTGATFAATAAQYGLNAAMYACPITWILAAIVALIAVLYMGVAAMNEFAGTSISATGIIAGAFMAALALIGNLFIGLWNLVGEVMVLIYNLVAAVANFIGGVFTDPIGAVVRLFFDLADTVLGVLQALASAIDAVFGSNLAGAVQGWRDSLGGWVDDTFGKGPEIMAKMDANPFKLDRFEYGAAYDFGYNWGANLGNFDGFGDIGNGFADDLPDYSQMIDSTGMPGNLDQISADTAAIKRSVSLSEEDMKMLVDMAERQYVNNIRLTAQTPIINVNGQNTGDTELDRQRLADALQAILLEQSASHTDLSYD